MTLLIGHRRRIYTPHQTSLEPLTRLTAWLGGKTRLWIKRDDRTGLALGGNKTRKLEFLMSDAIDQGCDTVITCGSVQSNHCRLTAAAAAKEGLQCHLVLREKRADQYNREASGNNLIYRLLGPEVHVVPPGTDLDRAMAKLATSLGRHGAHPYVIPMGGSNAIGALGYVACAEELLRQGEAAEIRPDAVVCASSSGGTQAGLVVGLSRLGVPVHGISVDGSAAAHGEVVWQLVRLTSAAIGRDPPERSAVIVNDAYVGAGYAEPTLAMVEAVRAFARMEGIVLDPVYTGKAAAGLIDLVRKDTFGAADVVFVHTGGSPALFELHHPTVP